VTINDALPLEADVIANDFRFRIIILVFRFRLTKLCFVIYMSYFPQNCKFLAARCQSWVGTVRKFGKT